MAAGVSRNDANNVLLMEMQSNGKNERGQNESTD
nr:MAG TPA: hypothetical protein [Caudoviricetes sp.]